MKRGTPDHWKMDDLADRLKIPRKLGRTWANGCLERLWHYTARSYPRGNVGAAPDWAIADACGWPREGAEQLVRALIDSRWLDPHPTHRLIVHDWHEHADESVKKTLKNRGLSFCFLENSSTVSTTTQENSVLPLPLPLPLPEPSRAEPSPERARPATATANDPPPTDTEQRIRRLAEQQPDPQDFETGIDVAVREVLSASDPPGRLALLERNLPAWWDAMRDGRAKTKQLRYVILDRDYLRLPRAPAAAAGSKRAAEHQARKDAWDEVATR